MSVQAPDADNPAPVTAINDSVSIVAAIPEAILTSVSDSGLPASGAATTPPITATRLLVATTAAVTSPVVDRGGYRGLAALVIANIGTGAPTELVDIQGSVDNVNFYNIAYALVATPNTATVAQITITATATTTYLLLPDHAWRYLRVVISAVTTQTTWVTYYQ